jgi:tetratricopeptide (TPR) repeat protein
MHLIDQQLNLMIRGRFDEAWKIAEELEKEYPDDARAKFNRGWHLINQGKFQEGFKCLEYGRGLNVYGSGKINSSKPIWDQSDLTGKTVIINLEAGYGDNIIYARFATEVWRRGGKCILCCDKTLHSIFMQIPGVHSCITLDQVELTFHDYWIPGFSCSWLFGHTAETLPNEPYIFAKQESVELWKSIAKTDKKFKVGIRWSGNPKFEHQQFRIFPAEKLINLHKNNDHIQFYSLQRDSDLKELPEEITDLQHFMISWDDTAACIENLDLVITSCTSVAHLASAMGKPTWVIVPLLPYHIWAYGGDNSPWYQKSTRVFRQQKFGEWDDVFETIRSELTDKFVAPTK